MAGHGRFEAMAVGHVLGGLDDVDAATFRAHLLQCADCRKRVNELRDIASDLAATEREERAATRAAVEVETRTDPAPPEVDEVTTQRSLPWTFIALSLVPLLLLGTLAWAVWVRAQADVSAAVVVSQQRVLEILASGDEVAWNSAERIRGTVATDGTTVAVNLVDLPQLDDGEVLVIWLLDDEGTQVQRSRPFSGALVEDGSLVAAVTQPAAAAEFILSVEEDAGGLTAPRGRRLVSGPLPVVAEVVP